MNTPHFVPKTRHLSLYPLDLVQVNYQVFKSMSNYLLLYHCDLRDSPNVIEGRLLLIDTEKKEIIEKYIATSGAANWQEPDETWVRGKGALPEPETANLKHYLVKTAPVFLPHVKGVEGNFYPIEPFTIRSKTGAIRTDTGIHWDANVKGSAGCVVIVNRPAFTAFESRMTELREKQKLNELPLIVSYEK